MHPDTAYILTTRDYARYELDSAGNVVGRSNGPQGWNYGGKWIILGFLTRWNSRDIIPLSEVVSNPNTNVGHGYIVDLDHGTKRIWGGSGERRLRSLRANDDRATLLAGKA